MRKLLIKSLLARPIPQITTLNRKLIISIAGALLLLVIIIMVNALSDSAQHNAAKSASLVSAANANPPDSLSSLPADYSDAGQINTLLQQRTGGISAAAQAQLAALQNAQQTLQAQLAAMQQQSQNQQNQTPPTSPMDQQAATSSIFFAGGAPSPQSAAEAATEGTKASATSGGDKNTSGAGNTYQQQNMQGQKLDFLTSQPNTNIYDNNTVQYPASQYILQAGSVIPAILETKLTSNLPGDIVAIVNQDVYDSISGEYLLIPRGSKLIGEYNSSVSYGQEQLQAKFTRLIRPDGSSIILPNAPAADSMGSTGLEDEVDNHWGKIIGAATLSAIFNIPSIIATNQMQTSTTCPSGSTCTAALGATAGASALQAAGQSASNVGNQLASNSLNLQPTIVINSGKEFTVMVTKDIVLPPYTGQ